MGMKEPSGKALKIQGTVSSPSDVDNYTKIQNAATAPKNVTTPDAMNSSFPKIKESGKAKVF